MAQPEETDLGVQSSCERGLSVYHHNYSLWGRHLSTDYNYLQRAQQVGFFTVSLYYHPELHYLTEGRFYESGSLIFTSGSLLN